MAKKISASDLKALKNDFVIIDVREPDELAGARLKIQSISPLG